MYSSHLEYDASAAGEDLISVNRAERLAIEIALERTSGPDRQDRSTNSRMVWAGGFMQNVENLRLAEESALFRKIMFSPLSWACLCARIDSGRLPTTLWSMGAARSAEAVASGYLNACLHFERADGFDTARAGVRKLDELLKRGGTLVEWWQEIGRQYEADGPMTNKYRSAFFAQLSGKA